MNEKPCHRCLGWADSPEIVQAILARQFSPCEDCDQKPVIRALTQQYEMSQPRWWVVNNTQVVPIWVVDALKKKFKF